MLWPSIVWAWPVKSVRNYRDIRPKLGKSSGALQFRILLLDCGEHGWLHRYIQVIVFGKNNKGKLGK